MRRVNPVNFGADQDNYFIHLARYMFCVRQLKKSDIVFELGCGTGYGARLMSDFADKVYATDLVDMSDIWKKYKKNNLFFLANDNPSDKVDVVVSYEVVEHIEPEKTEDYFSRIKQVLKKNGMLFISTPRALPWEERSLNRQKEHAYEYNPQEFRDLLERHFPNVLLFAQNDSVIGSQNLNMAWNLVAVCING